MTTGRSRRALPARGVVAIANLRGSAAEGGTRLIRDRWRRTATAVGALIAVAGIVGCAARSPLENPAALGDTQPTGLAVFTAPPPSADERYCAWYGASDAGVLYFGQAPFWSAMRRAGGDPTADLRRAGPQLVGRFDLARERWLPALDVGGPEMRSGVWDVALLDGQLFFSTFYEPAGIVHLDTGRVQRLALGEGLNEWAPGPDGTLLVTRYGSGVDEEGNGSVLAVDGTGALRFEWRLDAPSGYRNAPKTPAWDAVRAQLWVTTDLLPAAPAGTARQATEQDRHDAYVLSRNGELLDTVAAPEVQFAASGPDGRFHRAVVGPSGEGHALRLEIDPADADVEPRSLLLDPAFPPASTSSRTFSRRATAASW